MSQPEPRPDDRPACVVCRRRRTDTRVCQGCTDLMAGQLGELPELERRLPLAQVRAQGVGERVSGSRSAPLPLRIDPLSLTAGDPRVADWTVDQADQSGDLPIGAWVDAWAWDWRRTFGHALPERSEPRLAPERPAPAVTVGAGWLRTPAAREALSRYLAEIEAAARRDLARLLLGLGDALPRGERPEDPVADEWAVRWRDAGRHVQLGTHVRYLTTWLDHACDTHPDVVTFAASLRALVGSAHAALGDGDDLTYLGRCPVPLLDRETGVEAPCGAGLWSDPHVSVITCNRCKTETPERGWLRLAGAIRRVWPLDPRRRYTRAETEALAGTVPCQGCGVPLDLRWVGATERRDARAMWRLTATVCPAACGTALGQVAS